MLENHNKENIDKLLKRLKAPVFRFIIIKTIADAYFAEHIKKRIEKEIPERKTILLTSQGKNYRTLMDTVYNFEKGIVLIEDFDKLLENNSLSISFNQRRDKFAQLDIAFVVFVNSKESIRKIMSDLPDLWSFRTPVIELDYTTIKKKDFEMTISQSIGNYDTNIGKEAAKENIIVLNKRLENLEIKEENLNLINSTYFRLFENYKFLGLYKEGLKKVTEFEKIVIQYKYEADNPEIYTEFLSNLATFSSDLGDYNKSLKIYNKIIGIGEKIYDKNHPDLVTYYNNVALVYQNLGNYSKALEFNHKTITGLEKIADKNYPDLSSSYNNIAMVYQKLGNYQKALEFNNKAISIREKIYDKNHPDLAISYVNIANSYYDLKNYQKAKIYNKKALRIFKKKLPTGHLHIKIAEVLEEKINLVI